MWKDQNIGRKHGFKLPHLQKYLTPEMKKLHKNSSFIPVSLEDRWKAIVIAMHHGDWMQIKDIQKVTGFKRKRVRCLMEQGIEMGVIQRSNLVCGSETITLPADEEMGIPPKKITHQYHRRYYRLLTDQVNIITQEDPTD